MSYQLKYYYEFYSQDTHRLNRVDIYQNTEDILVSKEVVSIPPAFLKEMPSMGHKFDVVIGSGCEINLLSETSMEFFNGFYHVDPKEFRVEHFIDGELNWIGYLNSEMTSESYEYETNYPFQITGNDGFALMDRYYFVDENDNDFNGIKSKFEILTICLGKIGLPWSEIVISISTSFPEFSGSVNKTILHESYVQCSNYYDEDGEPMTVREVIESILAPYGANIRSEQGNIFITDINTVASSETVSWKRFSYSTQLHLGDYIENNRKTIKGIGYTGKGQRIDRSGGINKQTVVYSPYPSKDIIDDSVSELGEFSIIPDTLNERSGYSYRTLGGNINWNVFSPATFEGNVHNEDEEEPAYIRCPLLQTNQKIAELKINPFLFFPANTIKLVQSPLFVDPTYVYRPDQGVLLSVTADINVITSTAPYDDDVDPDLEIRNFALKVKVKVGDNWGVDGVDGWKDIDTFGLLRSDHEVSIVDHSNSFRGSQLIVSMTQGDQFDLVPLDVYGNLTLELWSDIRVDRLDNYITEWNSSEIKEFWIKNISVRSITVARGEISDSDVEYQGTLNSQFKDSGEDITITCGTESRLIDRGQILRFDPIELRHMPIYVWTRGGQNYKIEELLLNSVVSNYREGFISLNGISVKSDFSTINILTDEHIPNSLMMINSASIDYQGNSADINLFQISPDELIIKN